MKILLLTTPIPPSHFADAIAAHAPELSLLEYHDGLGDAELADVEVVLAWQLPAGITARLPRLKWVSAIAAGVDKLLVPDLPAGVAVSRIVDPDQGEGIGQYVALMALRHARGLARYEAQQRERLWQRRPVAAVRSRVGVLGTGAMGGAIMSCLSAVGFAVRGWSRSSGTALEAVLAASDIVVCALPLTDATRGILNAARFVQMPAGSYLINVARGEHVVEADLIAAVAAGHLAGAALDVQCHEPMAADDPLWAVPGITVTPHIAAQSSPQTIAAQFVASYRRVAAGQDPLNRVDRTRGY